MTDTVVDLMSDSRSRQISRDKKLPKYFHGSASPRLVGCRRPRWPVAASQPAGA